MAANANPHGSDDAVRTDSDAAPSDGSLLRDYRLGDQDAARQLYLRYAGRLRALARARTSADLAIRVDDDDIVQSVFGSFFRRVSEGVYDVPAGEELWNLFLVITLNKIRAKGAHHRAAKRDIRHTTGDTGIEEAPDPLSSDNHAITLLHLSIEEVLERLSERHRQAIRLRMQGYEVAEIAEATKWSKRSIERLLQQGRERLSELLPR